MRARHPLTFFVFLLCLSFIPLTGSAQGPGKLDKAAVSRLKNWQNPVNEWHYPAKLAVDSARVDASARVVSIWFPPSVAGNPVRESHIEALRNSLAYTLGRKFRNYGLKIFSGNMPVEQLVPNYFRSGLPADKGRIPQAAPARPILVERVGAVSPDNGLAGRYIALWHSHGYYFDIPLDRWEYQRAKLFGTVEDLSVMAYVVPYLAPMLENAGATVFLPRERDVQVNEVIVDNDISTGRSEFVIQPAREVKPEESGFLKCDTLFTGENPFTAGTSVKVSGAEGVYVPDIPEKGYYSVNVAYKRDPSNSRKAIYHVTHLGGSTDFTVDQSAGGSTWLYLGTFLFGRGLDRNSGSVTVTSGDGRPVSLDAIRFGGGMGNVARRPAGAALANQTSLSAGSGAAAGAISADTTSYTWKISGMPRFMEGARYWLQYAGMPDSIVYSPNKEKNDYNDDYMSRSEWVNYLAGSAGKSGKEGLGIPIDLSFAFHTDAGITQTDSVIGTLGIYSTASGNGLFPDGTGRLASRDLTDIVQTQITSDISTLFNSRWTRREMWDRSYYEARKPNVPAMLLELLSHQNLADQKYGLDPRFRFAVSRAVYKGILKYLAANTSQSYVVQPLPVNGMSITPLGGKRIRLTWQPVSDPLEPTATPVSFRVYSRTGENGFDNGTPVSSASFETELPEYNTVYSFRVTAVNGGGESFPSEVVAAGFIPGDGKAVVVVNMFDRVSGPAWFDTGSMAGVEWWNDRGVAYNYSFEVTGDQYDFNRKSPWTDDDNAGWGASYTDRAGMVTPGNTFDFAALHGKAILSAGHSFVSVSDEVFIADSWSMDAFSAVDLLCGEEKTTPPASVNGAYDFQIYTPAFMSALRRLSEGKIPVFMSGSYIGTDLSINGDTATASAVASALHFKPRTGHAVKGGNAFPADQARMLFGETVTFNSGQTASVYAAEAPDAIEPAGKDARTAYRYGENNTSAAVMNTGQHKTFVLGFPFETITSEEERNGLMKEIINFLEIK